jgi:hypothetical protein
MRKLLFRDARRRPAAPALPQGFDVCVRLRKGDKIVRRNERGDVEIVRVTSEVARLDASGAPRPTA